MSTKFVDLKQVAAQTQTIASPFVCHSISTAVLMHITERKSEIHCAIAKNMSHSWRCVSFDYDSFLFLCIFFNEALFSSFLFWRVCLRAWDKEFILSLAILMFLFGDIKKGLEWESMWELGLMKPNVASLHSSRTRRADRRREIEKRKEWKTNTFQW